MHVPSTGRRLKAPRTKKSILGRQYQKCSRRNTAKSFPWIQLMIATVVELRPVGSSPGALSAQSENARLNDSFTLVRNAEIIRVQGFRMFSSWTRRLFPVSMFCARFQLTTNDESQRNRQQPLKILIIHRGNISGASLRTLSRPFPFERLFLHSLSFP
jgi:hypothetical protein